MAEITKALKVTALMTSPRHEIVLARNYIEIALRQAGVPLVISGGVFYGQCMQRMLQDAIDSGADVAITVDFDSMFVAADITKLLQALVSDPEINAVAALQCRRGVSKPLLATSSGTAITTDGLKPFRVATAHFGLTAIDLHKLKEVPKPWFWSRPDANGDWSTDKIDDDIGFWNSWKDAGKTVYIDPKVRIGHMEEMVTVYDEDLKPVHVYPWDWAEEAYNKTRGTLIFVGTNLPDESLQKFVKQHRYAHLFEPLPSVAEELRKTFADSRGVNVVQAACGEAVGVKPFHVYNKHGESSSLGEVTQQAKDVYNYVDLTEKGCIEVMVHNLGNYCHAKDIGEIEHLIIDAQGMDLTILKTMDAWIGSGLIKNIQCEADGPGFQHYEGLPANGEADFLEYMEQFPHYTPGRVEGRQEFAPDLTWTLNQDAKIERRELCRA